MIAAKAEFVGIDLTSSSKKPSAYAALDAALGVIGLGFLGADSEVINAIDKIEPLIVAIDAPLSLPKGLCCLEETCPCREVLPSKGRACERELARLGIPCFFTTKKSIIKEMVYRAIALKQRLSRYNVIEIYPYASKVRLFGKPIPSKLKPAGIEVLRALVTDLVPDLIPKAAGLNHDLCDAVIAAYSAYLYYQGMAEPVGDPGEGQIFIPSPLRELPLSS